LFEVDADLGTIDQMKSEKNKRKRQRNTTLLRIAFVLKDHSEQGHFARFLCFWGLDFTSREEGAKGGGLEVPEGGKEAAEAGGYSLNGA